MDPIGLTPIFRPYSKLFFLKFGGRRVITSKFNNNDQENVMNLNNNNIQGDQKLVPPLPGQDEKSSRQTEDSIFKYNLFKYYLEIMVVLG